ncbi:MAG: M1 family aminopeptidase [Acidobacteriota bacterium]|nr:M1 family aminopeptidase [Acidobacteriota bacterium]
MERRFFSLAFLLIFLICISPLYSESQQSINELITKLQTALERKDIPAYLNTFSPELRLDEKESLESHLRDFEADSISVFPSFESIEEEDETTVFLRVLFQNSYSVFIELWKLSLFKENGRWLIKDKEVKGNVKSLYRLKIPSDRVEVVKRIEIKHVDIQMVFKNAICFFDNIPKTETALLVIGEGRLYYSPSLENEKHQLGLFFKKTFLDDRLKYAYLRFSNSFFEKNIKIVREDKKQYAVTKADINKAYSLFMKHYPRSFTVENSLNRELLSVLPQGDEAVFEFESRKTGVFTYVYSPFAREEVNLFHWEGEKIINIYSPQIDKETKRFFISFGQMYDVEDYQIDINFAPKDSYLSGRAKIIVKSEINSLNELKFRLHPDLEILRINDEENRKLFYSRDKLRKILYIYLLHSVTKGQSASIEIFYRGKIIPPDITTDVLHMPQMRETNSFISPKYDTYLFSQSSYWYPAPPDDDYFKARLKIIVPSEYNCISNGVLIEQSWLRSLDKVEDFDKLGNSVCVFETKVPVKYLSFIVGKFDAVEEDFGSIPFARYKPSKVILHWKNLLKDAKDIFDFYVNLFGPYPFEKLTIVHRLWPASGGHSPASFIVLNELPRIPGGGHLVKAKSPVDLPPWKEHFLAHEIAHQWWGQGLAWKTYHDQWISEGLAQYSAVLFLKKRYGERVFSQILKKFSEWTEKKSDKGQITMGSRISYVDFEAYQAIVYNKTSLILNMLKDYLGEEVFFDGLKEFFSRYKYKAADTNAFFRTFNDVSGKELKPFFDMWFNSYHLPDVKVSYSIQKREDGYFLEFKITQSEELFVFPLEIEWKEGGKKVLKTVTIDKKMNEFGFLLEDKPKKIKVNPRRAIPGKFNLNYS